MTVDYYIKYLFYNPNLKESKKNKSINEKYRVCYCNKKTQLYIANLELSLKSNCLCR